MRKQLTAVGLLCLAATVTSACGGRPDAEIDAAIAAEQRAYTAEASRYAADAMRQVEESRARLDAELTRQERYWLPSYDQSREFATTLKLHAQTAAREASMVRTKVEAEEAAAERAAARRATANTALTTRARASDPVKLTEVLPEYPDIARSAGVDGTVTIAARVGADGAIADAKVVNSVPLLDRAALDAVRQWTYKPSRLNGKAVPADLVVNVQFVR